MGNPRIYYYPDPTGTLEGIDLKEGLTELQELPRASVSDAAAGDGSFFRHHLATRRLYRFYLERFGPWGSSDLELELQALQTHLFNGGIIGISDDHAKTWAGLAASAPSRGDTVVYTGGNGFVAWSSSGAPVEGDEMVLESPHPEALLEVVRCGPLTVSPPIHLPVDPRVRFTYQLDVLARYRGFLPIAWLPQDQVGKPIVTWDKRRNFTLDMILESAPAMAIALWDGGEAPDLRDGLSIGGESLQGLLKNAASLFTPPPWSF